jgi:hypothetical protein
MRAEPARARPPLLGEQRRVNEMAKNGRKMAKNGEKW